MFNIAVFNIKDLIKYLAVVVLSLILIIVITRILSREKDKLVQRVNFENKIEAITQKSYVEVLDEVIPEIVEKNDNNNSTQLVEEDEIKDELMQKIINVELAKIDVTDNNTNQIQEEEEQEEKKIQEADVNIETQVVTPEPIEAIPTDTYNDVQIRNQTGYVLSEEMLTPNIDVDASNVIIFHTHTCESYTQTEENQYESSGNYRTIDLEHSVARVGDELEKYLLNYGYNVIHDKTYHDYPAYTGSYTRSLETVTNLLNTNPADVVIDLHRDAIGSNSNYAPTVKIGEDYCAQLMFVIGSDGGGLWHPNWNQNLKFAIKVQQKAEELYPGLFKPIILRNSRYNQHVAKGACIIEVGATGNTLEQCLCSMKYLAKVYKEIFN